MKKLGQHLLVEYSGCDVTILNSMDKIEKILLEAARLSGATIVESVFHQYNPHGLSGVVVIAESHMSIHTWPEYGYAAVDFFTCGERIDPWKACRYMREMLACSDMQTRELLRGIPGGDDEVLPHKPTGKQTDRREVA